MSRPPSRRGLLTLRGFDEVFALRTTADRLLGFLVAPRGVHRPRDPFQAADAVLVVDRARCDLLLPLREDLRAVTNGDYSARVAADGCESALKNRARQTVLLIVSCVVGRASRIARANAARMQRIIVLNPKGGSGKTTIASNLAACYAANGQRPALMDSTRKAPACVGSASAPTTRRRFTASPHSSARQRSREAGSCVSPRNVALSSSTRRRPSIPTVPGDHARRGRGPRARDAVRHRHPRDSQVHRRLAARREDSPRGQRIGIIANRVRANTWCRSR